MKLTILMPSLNEEDSIGQTIKSIPIKILLDSGWQTEILIIDGGSQDKTAFIAQSLGAKVLSCQKGYGRQYQYGFSQAKGDIIITADSDNSYPMGQIPDLLKTLHQENLDFISANRFAGLEPGAMRRLNKLGNIILTRLANLLFKLDLKDSQSGMWVIRKSALAKLNLKSPGMPLSQEIKIEAFTKLRAREVDSSYQKRIGQVKLRMFRDGWQNLVHLFRKRFNNK